MPGKSYTQRQIVKIVLLDWIEGIKLLKPSFNLSFTDKRGKNSDSKVLPLLIWLCSPPERMLLPDKLPFILIAAGTSFEDTFTLT